MKDITTKFYAASFLKKARIKAVADGGHIVILLDPALSLEDNHKRAAQALCKKMNWVGRMTSQRQASKGTYVFSEGQLRRPPEEKLSLLEQQMMADLGI